ncbi:MAG: ribonuclease III [Candidatus Lightella neohaematopini]|nr:ribonuclease III [Candidatus Lightella neohaematopini]MCV2529003.1 ribonuclease III [Candidatus Lightella neohaematopini]
MNKNINNLQYKLGYYFNKLNLLIQALTHRSTGLLHNERLEFLGDAVLNYIISKNIYNKFLDINEGSLSQIRSILVCSNTLVEVANELKLSNYLYLGLGEVKNNGSNRVSILEDTLEAIIGSILIDSNNINTVENIILKLFNNKIKNIDPYNKKKDSKTMLQEYLQSQHLPLPTYKVIKISGSAHEQNFIVHCQTTVLNNPTIGNGSSRRKAEQEAAKQTLKLINLSI